MKLHLLIGSLFKKKVFEMSFDRNGIRIKEGGVHTSRTIMLDELIRLFNSSSHDATLTEYYDLIVNQNCLGKISQSARKKTFKYMKDLYSLDGEVLVFKALRFYYYRDPKSAPLLALLMAAARDSIIKRTSPMILGLQDRTSITRTIMEEYVQRYVSNNYSLATLESTAINVNSSFTQSGHLNGKVIKIRQKVHPTPSAIAFALLLSFLEGGRGELMFESFWIHLLDCTPQRAIELAEMASSFGYLSMKKLSDVIEVTFPELILS